MELPIVFEITQAITPAMIIGGASALGSIISGLVRGSRARRLERNNPRPVATVNDNILKNVAVAENLARVGLPGYNNMMGNILRNQAGAVRLAGTSGRGVNVANILSNTNRAVQDLGVANEEARIANERLAMGARSELAQEEQRVWNWNDAMRYQEMAQRIASLRQAGQQDLFGGLGMLGQMAVAGVFGGATDHINFGGKSVPTNTDGLNWGNLTGTPQQVFQNTSQRFRLRNR